jgi:hypothetical protein
MFLLSFIRNRIIKNRLKKNLAKYQRLLSVSRTYSFSKDGVLSKVKDMLSEIFGYEQKEIISGNSIQFFDIAVKINKKFIYMIKCLPIDVNLNNIWTSYRTPEEAMAAFDDVNLNNIWTSYRPSSQEIEYSFINKVNWIIFTNGIEWQIYAASFKKTGYKIEFLASFNILSMSYMNKNDIELLTLIAKEGVKSSFHKKMLHLHHHFRRAEELYEFRKEHAVTLGSIPIQF